MNMNGIEEQKIMLYSPRQMEVATLLAGPICAVYMLTANYHRLEKLKYARNVTFIGSIIVLLWHLVPVSDKVPQMVYQTVPLLIVWVICKKYHISKQDILEEPTYIFRSNWIVLLVSIIGWILLFIFLFIFLAALNLFGLTEYEKLWKVGRFKN